MKNTRPAHCVDCGCTKPAGHGQLFKARGREWVGSNGQRYQYAGQWVVFCNAAHLAAVVAKQAAEDAALQRRIDKANGLLTVEPPAVTR